MEKKSTTDSNYGSARTAEQSSMSSFSVGSSGVATGMHSKGSTSGCSSGISDENQNRKDKKKEQIKKCLQELKSLMPQQGKSKAGTVSTLKTVLHHMKKIKGEESAQKGADIELLGALPEGECSNMEFPFTMPDSDRKDWLKIIMSVKECLVLQVSPELLDMLGYPKNYWFNQCLIDYVYKRDVVTISSNLSVSRGQTKTQQTAAPSTSTMEESGEEAEDRKTMFFFRLRHYKSLRQGFSLSRTDKYSVLCGQARVQKVQLSFPPGTPAEGLQSDNKYLVLECLPLQSAYTVPNSLPEKRSFSTRHTIYCNYNFIHPTALPLLGYLPQDMIGSSVFDYYHPQDLYLLLSIYQQVIQMPGETFRSPAYRMRTKNGDYVMVETEWSSFVNPWTKRLDFIMGQHQVVQGPCNPDVFMETVFSRRPVMVNAEHRQIHKKIKSLLLQSVGGGQRSLIPPVLEAVPSTSRMYTTSSSSPLFALNIQDSEIVEKPAKRPAEETQPVEEGAKEEEERASPTQSVGTNSSLLTLSEEEKALIYERLNYAQNILRFLNSCQIGEGLEDVGQKQASPYAKEGSESSDGEGLTVEVDIPKPPSCASSTKALVSDQEAREEVMPPSPAHEEIPDDSQQREPGADDIYEPISLTEDVLKMHNLLQEQYYLQKMTREKEGFKSILQEGKTRKKRLLNEDTVHKKAAKFLRQEDGQPSPARPSLPPAVARLAPPFPITKLDTPCTTSAPSLVMAKAQQSVKQMKPGATPTSVSVANMPSHFVTMGEPLAMSYTPLMQMPVSVSSSPSPNIVGQSGLQWPFYHPQAGVQFMQPIFYQPIMAQPLTGQPVLNQGCLNTSRLPANLASSTTSTAVSTLQTKPISSTPSLTTTMERQKGSKSGESGKDQEVSDTLSLGDTGSSILYLLESNSGSQNNSSNSDADQSEEDKKKKKKKQLPAAPPWVAAVGWSEELVMRYRMPNPPMNKVLKEDRAALKKCKQHASVVTQLQELLAQVEDTSEDSYPKDEEADVLYVVEQVAQLDTESQEDLDAEVGAVQVKPASPSHSRNSPNSLDMDLSDSAAKDKEMAQLRQILFMPTDTDDQDEEGSQEKMEMSPGSVEESPKGCSSPDKMSHDSDSGSSDVGSKGSSDLTPSDQRSHEEVVSSVKESDNASSESGSSKEKNPGSASETEKKKEPMTRNTFVKLFVPIKIEFVSMPMHDPVWVQEANFSPVVQMTYTKDNADLGATLKEDKKTLDYCQQPDLVKSQLNELVMSLKKKSPSKENLPTSESMEFDSKLEDSEHSRNGSEDTQESQRDKVKKKCQEEESEMDVKENVDKDTTSLSLEQSMECDKPLSSSDDEKFVHPSQTHRKKSKVSTSSSSGCSPEPSAKASNSSPEPGQPSSSDSDTWEQLRQAVKSSMTSFFEVKDCEVANPHVDKKDSLGQSIRTSSEQSSDNDFSQHNTVEDLMEQLFKNEETDSIGLE